MLMSNVTNVTLPNIGDYKSVEVIEILVNVGQTINKEDSLITIESEKASMDIPSPCDGIVVEIRVNVGDEISEDSLILLIDSNQSVENKNLETESKPDASSPKKTTEKTKKALPHEIIGAAKKSNDVINESDKKVPSQTETIPNFSESLSPQKTPNKCSHASPAVRRFGRELGVELALINGSGRKGRILKSDIEQFVKNQLLNTSNNSIKKPDISLEKMTADFSQWGSIEIKPLSRIQKRSGTRLLNAWNSIPHVTNHEEVDITNLEDFRKSYDKENRDKDLQITLLPFLMKAIAVALNAFPQFNSSLAPNEKDLIFKKYINIGVAVDTQNGLIVPVIKDIDKKNVRNLAIEIMELSAQSRDGKIKPNDLKGGCFTISNLGGIGGRSFTPIVNPPEVAILGVSRAKTMPEWNGREFIPRLMLPLDLSYDHRVIDGASAARFLTFLKISLEDIRRLLL